MPQRLALHGAVSFAPFPSFILFFELRTDAESYILFAGQSDAERSHGCLGGCGHAQVRAG